MPSVNKVPCDIIDHQVLINLSLSLNMIIQT
jgi:hypothetical protein